MTSPRAFLLAVGLALALPRFARAEDTVAYKYADYRESDGRIAVQTQGAYLEKDLGTDTRLKVTGIIDAIAGATPTGQTVNATTGILPLTNLTERRKAWTAELSRQIDTFNLAASLANSRESDYVSNAWALNTRTDFNQKNTTLLLGVSSSSDRIKVRFQVPDAHKHTTDYIIGITQLMDEQTSLQVNFGYGRATGFLSDQYKLVEKLTEVVPGAFLPLTFFENRPPTKDKWLWRLSINRDYPEINGALEAAYRGYNDSFGIDSSTIEFTYFQHLLGDYLILQPNIRYYRQSQADFYHYNLNTTSITPTFGVPPSQGPYYSSDYRLSAFNADTAGLKAVVNITPRFRLDAAIERYRMRGRDHVTPQAAYITATTATFGAHATW